MPRLLIAASGTGGHIFPALSIAEALPSQWEINWLGVPDRLDKTLVPSKYRLKTIKAQGLQGSWMKKLLLIFQVLKSTQKVRAFLLKEKVDIVFTTGGYIAAPAILGAIFCQIPIVIHESNAVPGKVTRFLGRFCTFIALGLPIIDSRERFPKAVITGTPVRQSFLEPQQVPSWVPPGSGPLIVVMGGSQGALCLNQMARKALPSFLEQGCRVVHLSGQNDPDIFKLKHPNYVEKEFTNEVPGLLQAADLAISRAGSGALSELSVCETPAILIPYPQAADNHQEANAICAAELGAAVIVHQHNPEENVLKDTINRLLKNRIESNQKDDDPLIKMKHGMQLLANRDAKIKLLELFENLI